MSVLVPTSASAESASATPQSIGSVVAAKQPVAPAPTPTVTGVTTVGDRLAAKPGAWGSTPVTFRYQWNRDGVAIPAGTNSTYLLKPEDADKRLSVTVTGSATGFLPVSRTSAASLKVVRPFVATSYSTITGGSVVGDTAAVKEGTWSPSPTTIVYTWTRDNVPIPGANGPRYVLQTADGRRELRAVQTISRAGYATTTREFFFGRVQNRFTDTPAPVIVGTAAVGQTLRASVPAWTPQTTEYWYYWYRNGVQIRNEQHETYTVRATDRGATISTSVYGLRNGYATVFVRSNPTAPVK